MCPLTPRRRRRPGVRTCRRDAGDGRLRRRARGTRASTATSRPSASRTRTHCPSGATAARARASRFTTSRFVVVVARARQVSSLSSRDEAVASRLVALACRSARWRPLPPPISSSSRARRAVTPQGPEHHAIHAALHAPAAARARNARTLSAPERAAAWPVASRETGAYSSVLPGEGGGRGVGQAAQVLGWWCRGMVSHEGSYLARRLTGTAPRNGGSGARRHVAQDPALRPDRAE